jgi:hypothetical protein
MPAATIVAKLRARGCDTDWSAATEMDAAFRWARSDAPGFVTLQSHPPGCSRSPQRRDGSSHGISGTARLLPFASAAEDESAGKPLVALNVTRFFCYLPAGTGRGSLDHATVVAIRNARAVEFRTRLPAISDMVPCQWTQQMFAFQIYAVGVDRGRLLRSRRRPGSGDRSPADPIENENGSTFMHEAFLALGCVLICWSRLSGGPRRARNVTIAPPLLHLERHRRGMH